MTDMRASPTLTDTPEHVAAVLAHPAVVLLPAAVIERIARIADGDSAHDDVLLRQVTLILCTIEIAISNEDAHNAEPRCDGPQRGPGLSWPPSLPCQMRSFMRALRPVILPSEPRAQAGNPSCWRR